MKEIYELMDRFAASAIAEMEVEYHGIKVSMKKGVSKATDSAKEEAHTISRREAVEAKGPRANAKNVVVKEGSETIKAPLVGTFYRSPAPGEPPFVTPGQTVAKGDVVAIIEAMKMMNEIVASRDGIIDEILVEDETMVEFNQPLIVLK